MASLRGLVRLLVLGRRNGVRARLRRRLGLARNPVPAGPAAQRVPTAPAPTADSADTGFQPVLRCDALPAGQLAEVLHNGQSLVVYNVEGAFFATSGTCPHAGGPIGDGAMQGSVVTCPYHGWAFDVRDGRCAVDPSVKLPTFETRVVAGEICVRA